MTRVINLDSDTCAQDALGRRVIDLDFALAQVRADAEKIYVKDPRVKGGGYYRVVKSGGTGGSSKARKPSKKKPNYGDFAKGAAAAGAITAGVVGTSKLVKMGSEQAAKALEKGWQKQAAKTNPMTGKPYEQSKTEASNAKPVSAEETQPDIKAAKEAERIEWEGVEYKLTESGEQQPSPQSRLSNVKEGLDKTKSELEEMSKKAQEQIEKSKKFMEERKRKKQQDN